MTTFDVAAVRAELPAVRRCVFFNAGMFGPLPRVADAAMRAHMDLAFERGRTNLDCWFGPHEAARRAFARTLSAHEDTIALTHSTSDSINTVVSGLPFEDGDEILTTREEHPGITGPLEELAHRSGVRIRTVAAIRHAIADAITPRTRLVAISHVLWTTGEILPVSSIAAAARARGALVLLDGAQSAGALEVDPDRLGADFYAVSGQKWLCGPSGTGALWVRPSVLGRLRTPLPWYLSKQRDAAGVRDWPSARRLDAPTVSITALAGITAALDWHRAQVNKGALGWAAALARTLRAELAAVPRVRLVNVAAPSSIVSFSVDGESAPLLVQRLEEAGVCVRNVGNYLRVSVGFWNDESDVAALLGELRRLLAAAPQLMASSA